jgi:signal transduction histidine kinase
MIKKLLHIVALLAITTVSPAFAVSDHGTRDEAIAMTERAKALFDSEGIDAVAAAVADPANTDFHDRDMYVFVLNMDGVMKGHGANVKLVGKNLVKLKDQNGVELIKEMIEATSGTGSGWVDYHWPNPATKKIEAKSSYVLKLSDEYFAGVGIYTQ